MLIEHEFPADGEYVFTVKGMTGYFTAVLGNVKGEKLEVTIDGERVYTVRLGQGDLDQARRRRQDAAYPDQGRLPRVGVTFSPPATCPTPGLNKSFQRTMNSPGSISGYTFYPHVGQVFIEGPYNGKPATSTQSRAKIFECYPEERRRGSRLRAEDHHDAGEEGVPPPGEATPTSRMLMAFFATGAKGGSFDTASRRRCSASWWTRSSSTAPRSSRPRSRPARPTGSATSSSRRGCRSSSGAAFRTRS
jgi:hypothetical protein